MFSPPGFASTVTVQFGGGNSNAGVNSFCDRSYRLRRFLCAAPLSTVTGLGLGFVGLSKNKVVQPIRAMKFLRGGF